MKKLAGLIFAVLIIVAPMAVYSQVEATAGSMKIGVHMDTTFRWSPESNKDPDLDEIYWAGYESVTMQDLFLELSGKIGDRVSYKILEGLVWEVWNSDVTTYAIGVPDLDMQVTPAAVVVPEEAYVDFKIIDQLKFRFGKQVTPTLLANTGVHQMDVVHTPNQPLIAQNSSVTGPLGVNQMLLDELTGWSKVPLPGSVTGAAAILSFSGVEINYTLFDEWLLEDGIGDLGYDFNKTKGGNVAVTYSGSVGPGKLTARGFYFDEASEIDPAAGSAGHVDDSGWGLGAMYNADKWFVGGEYTTSTYKNDTNGDLAPNKNTWYGYYVTVGGKFSSIQPVYRFDFIDYTNIKNSYYEPMFKLSSFDTEMWHTIGVNYLVNDNVTVGLNYVIKSPEKGKADVDKDGKYEDVSYPNANELVLIVEVDLL